MDHLVNQLLVFEGDGVIRLFNGNYTDYRDWLTEQPEEEIIDSVPDRTVDRTQTAERKKLSYKEKQEYENLQKEIATLENSKASITALLNEGTGDHRQLQKWSEEIQNLTRQVDEKTSRWIELAELVE